MQDSNDNSETKSAFLDVEKSFGGNRWQVREYDERLADTFVQRFDVPDIVGRAMASRGVELDDAKNFLNPTLRSLLPDPSILKGMDKAVERISKAVTTGEKVAIFGDYDVDGATSSALLSRFLVSVGIETEIYIPDRLAEGYGPNADAILGLQKNGASLLITVDCGTTSFEPLEAVAKTGLDVIIVDHHEAEAKLPPAVAVVNPKRIDDDSSYTYLAAVGVVFFLVVAVNRELRKQGWYDSSKDRTEPNLMQWLDLVALGTVCDVVPLEGVNRAFVKKGLEVISARTNAGLVALSDVSRVNERPTAYHLGYILGPRINAGGRVGSSGLGAKLLQTDDSVEAADIALKLNDFNNNRKDIESVVLFEAIEQAEENEKLNQPMVFVFGEKWHSGVVGIVAGRLKERYNLPACVMTLDEFGLIKCSGRSISGVDLGTTIIAARQAGLLVNGGGHAMAAGFSLRTDKIDDFREFLKERIALQIESKKLIPVLKVDGAVDISAITPDIIEKLSILGPFGSGNPEPRFIVPNVQISRADIVGAGHIRCFMTGQSRGRLKGIAFRAADTEIGQALLNNSGAAFHIAGNLRLDTWQGANKAQLIITDVAQVS